MHESLKFAQKLKPLCIVGLQYVSGFFYADKILVFKLLNLKILNMKKVNCDIWKSDFSEKGVEISVCDLIPYRLDVKFSKIIPLEEHIDFINNELAFLKSENYQRTTQNPLIETTHHKNGDVCFDFKDTEKDILYRVNPVKKAVWLEMFKVEYSKVISLFE